MSNYKICINLNSYYKLFKTATVHFLINPEHYKKAELKFSFLKLVMSLNSNKTTSFCPVSELGWGASLVKRFGKSYFVLDQVDG